jgi:pimeloyl-ACP methyl ester carboxylesterase
VTHQYGPYGVRSKYNVGEGFDTGGTDDSAFCTVFIASFGADPVGSADLMDTHDLDFALFTVFYPGVMPEGEKFPVITWGNGTCAMPEGYGALLRYVASHGYIVVAANSRWVGNGAAMRKGIDFMLAENMKQGSKYYQKIDVDNIGAMGHSQGGMGTAAAASDARIKSVILWNGGTTAGKPFLAVSGERDIFTTASSQLSNPVNAAPRPAAFLFYRNVPTQIDGKATGGSAGHLTLMNEPERVVEPAVAWWDMMLKGDATAKQMFVGASCGLCDPSKYPSKWVNPPVSPTIEYGHNTMLQ